METQYGMGRKANERGYLGVIKSYSEENRGHNEGAALSCITLFVTRKRLPQQSLQLPSCGSGDQQGQ
jgi:hypothetical protein